MAVENNPRQDVYTSSNEARQAGLIALRQQVETVKKAVSNYAALVKHSSFVPPNRYLVCYNYRNGMIGMSSDTGLDRIQMELSTMALAEWSRDDMSELAKHIDLSEADFADLLFGELNHLIRSRPVAKGLGIYNDYFHPEDMDPYNLGNVLTGLIDSGRDYGPVFDAAVEILREKFPEHSIFTNS